jgi:hypothetical protein
MKNIKLYEEFKNNGKSIVVYHRTSSQEHLEDLSFEHSDDEESVFGQAVYFSSSSDTSYQLGEYMGKYEIVLDKPLNLNIDIGNDKANDIMNIFLVKYGLESYLDYMDFNDSYDNISYGNLFLELQDLTWGESNKYYFDFIKNYLGYNSFYHYSDYGTNFIDELGDYGMCYGIYEDSDIKFIDFAN